MNIDPIFLGYVLGVLIAAWLELRQERAQSAAWEGLAEKGLDLSKRIARDAHEQLDAARAEYERNLIRPV